MVRDGLNVVPLLLEVNKGFGGIGEDGRGERGGSISNWKTRFEMDDDELPPSQLPGENHHHHHPLLPLPPHPLTNHQPNVKIVLVHVTVHTLRLV